METFVLSIILLIIVISMVHLFGCVITLNIFNEYIFLGKHYFYMLTFSWGYLVVLIISYIIDNWNKRIE